jgi:hypothetical protein
MHRRMSRKTGEGVPASGAVPSIAETFTMNLALEPSGSEGDCFISARRRPLMRNGAIALTACH